MLEKEEKVLLPPKHHLNYYLDSAVYEVDDMYSF